MERFSVRGLRRAMRFLSRPRSAHTGHLPTTTSGSWFEAQAGSMHCTRGLLRKAVTFTWGMPQVGHFSGTASILPLGSG